METTENNTVKITNEAIVKDGKMIATITYITIIGLIIAFVMNNEKKNAFASYHIKQSLGLALTGLALGVIGMIPILGWIINIFGIFVLLYMWIMGLVNAINGQEKAVPILGNKYIEWFKNL
ncbi:MAG: hypothetical protein GW839_00025 [Flavobacteriales bacterium]|nr:hypothetical protein [Flavobacteriia bacterium]NCP06808.1 hypothetical protein [Flavobacteriales bacterium]PIV92944.1 MAG: hypothetical protein COW44_12080 [Flavobacteriaceae bacterium CG17_big_fil_post_rev_8_21_14_2_50_33_15]PIY12303.1 MAG: hypothetical protein COZ17_04010 [Flavobacteriaceae bacterium CG_4_10_14_3_um_filter_33_47]PJB19529.1 MAG: hypothetical protein CO117_04270 [Flavobacteriaceae bacterium CG_4_9_14_3_um_filter_33_16]